MSERTTQPNDSVPAIEVHRPESELGQKNDSDIELAAIPAHSSSSSHRSQNGEIQEAGNHQQAGDKLPDGQQHMQASAVIPTSDQTQLKRCLKERHLAMLALSGTIGSGLFISTGEIIALTGPGGALISYAVMGFVYSFINSALAEMTAFTPNIRVPVVTLAKQWLGSRTGFAVGWLYWFAYSATVCAQTIAVSSLMKFEYDDHVKWSIVPWVGRAPWIALAGVIIIVANLPSVRIFADFQVCVGWFKIVLVTALTLVVFIIPSGKTWVYPYGFFTHNGTIVNGSLAPNGTLLSGSPIEGNTGIFVSLWSAMNISLFSYVGLEISSVAAGEVEDTIIKGVKQPFKIAARKTNMRVILLYFFATVSACEVALAPGIRSHLKILGVSSGLVDGASSPFILAIIHARIPALPYIINAFFIFSAITTGFVSLYVSTRILHVLAEEGYLFGRLARNMKITSDRPFMEGVPTNAVLLNGILCLSISFLGSTDASYKAFGFLRTMSVMSAMAVNVVICIMYLRFFDQNNAQKFNRDNKKTYPFTSKFQPWKTGLALFVCVLVIVFGGYRSFLHANKHHFNVMEFFASYLSIGLFILAYLLYNFQALWGTNVRESYRESLKWPSDPLTQQDMEKIQFYDPKGKREGRLYSQGGIWEFLFFWFF